MSCICQCELPYTETQENTDRIIHVEDYSYCQELLSKTSSLLFHREVTSTFWFMRHYICHRLIAATCSQWGKHHKTSKLCKDADTRTSSKSHKHKPLCTLHNISCPEGCKPHCNCPYETGDL